jgi:hypothetical protein
MAERLMVENKKAAEQKAQKEQQASAGASDEPRTLATAQEHHATPGPALVNAEQLGEPESKEALKKRSEELNK